MDISQRWVDPDSGGGSRTEAVQEQLVAKVYDELKHIAQAHNRKEQFDATLQTTALVHEAWLRIAESDAALQPKTDAHLKALTSRVIRHVLVDYARQATARKRSPDDHDVEQMKSMLVDQALDVNLLDLDEAMHALAKESPRLVQVIEFRFFGGMSIPEAAEVLGVSPRTVERDWLKARAYLLQLLRDHTI